MCSEEDPNIQQMTLDKVKEILPDAAFFRVKEFVFLLKREMPPEKIIELEQLLIKFPDLKILPRTVRKVVDYAEVRSYIGHVELQEGRATGVSGVEKERDSDLSGSMGIYEVMLDRHKNWVSGTWQLKCKAVPGKDVKLDLSLEEIKKQQRKLNSE
jgi:cell division protein FtsI/penicillin-binding protein 2